MLPVFLQARASDAAVRGAVSQAPRTGRQLRSLLPRSSAGGHPCRRVGHGCFGRRPGRAGTRRWRASSPRSRRSRTEPVSRPRPEISSSPRARHAHLVSPARSPVPYQPLPTATRVSGPGAAHGLANLSTFLSISALAPPSRPYLQAIVGSDIRNRNPRVGVRVPPPAWLSVLYELLLAAAVVATLSKFGESNGACRRPTSRTPRPGDT